MGYLNNRLHVCWIITAACLGFLLGVGLAGLITDIYVDTVVIIVAGLVLLVVALCGRSRLFIPGAVLAGLLLGWARGNAVATQLDCYDDLIGDEVVVGGVINDDPSPNDDGLSANLYEISLLWREGGEDNLNAKLPGKLWFSLEEATVGQIRRTDRVVIRGVLDNGFGSYGATVGRAELVTVVHQDGADPMGNIRDDFAASLSRVMNDDEVGLGMGLLAGQKSVLDDDMQEAFVAASLTHILVASGYNLTVLVRFARRLLARYSRLLALILSITLILMFVGVTGASASMTRAMIVSILSLLLWQVGRKAHPVVLLSSVAALTIAVDPSQLWGDVGWYLSFSSFAGVIVLAPLLSDWVLGRADNSKTPDNDIDMGKLTAVASLARRVSSWPRSLGQVLLETASAQLATWLIIAMFMGNVSLVGLATNIVVLPLLPMAMLLTFVAGIGAIVLPVALAGVLAWPARLLLDFIITVATWGAKLPGASLEFQPEITVVIIYYVILILFVVVLTRITKHNFYGDNVIE